MSSGNILEVKDLYLYYKTFKGIVQAVDGISFKIPKGTAMGLVGESGCGKSSTANAIMRLLPGNTYRYEGSIKLDGMELMDLTDDEFRSRIRWSEIAMIFQGAMNSLNPVLKVGFQVAEPLIVHLGMPKEEALERARDMFEKVGLAPAFLDRYPHELSGGMRQRVVIAMAMVMNPKLLILDEPTSALDVSIQAQIMNLLKQLKKEYNLSMIFITHDIALASDISDYLAVMYAGQIVEYGPIEEVLLNPQHPYSQKLLASIPRLRVDKEPEFLPGAPPGLINPPKGCRFANRCPSRMDICDKEDPEIIWLNKDHFVKCHLYKGG
ncbi:ABC transporter ATP-binding protein [Candidatus Geothermarchaeota archaeon]|nr:MAG: ABC transporter ATP-binding protein [Candidatus Geothermarchaeota archaeon]HEW94386.1 ABC transporter ATP-binding protein [Thermoprotei archaeon]